MRKSRFLILLVMIGGNGGLYAGAGVGNLEYEVDHQQQIMRKLSAEQYEDIRLLSDLCTELEFSQSGMPVKGLPIKLLMRLIEKIARSSVHDFGKLLYSDQSFNIMRSLLHRIVVAIHNKVVPEQQNMSQEDRALMLVRGAMKAIVDLRDDKIDQMEFAQKTFVLGLCLLKLVVDIEEEAGYKVA